MIKFWWRSGSPGKTCLGGSMHCRSASSYVSKTCLAMHYSKVSTFWHQTQRISLPPQSVPHASCCLLDPFCSAYTHPTPAWLVEYLAMLVRTHTMSLTGNVICKKTKPHHSQQHQSVHCSCAVYYRKEVTFYFAQSLESAHTARTVNKKNAVAVIHVFRLQIWQPWFTISSISPILQMLSIWKQIRGHPSKHMPA